jgi:hypothetical protein
VLQEVLALGEKAEPLFPSRAANVEICFLTALLAVGADLINGIWLQQLFKWLATVGAYKFKDRHGSLLE